MRKYPYIIYCIYIICLPLLPILDILFMRIGGPTQEELKANIKPGPVRSFIGELGSYGIAKDLIIYIILGILILIGIIMSIVFFARKKDPDEAETKKLVKLNLITQIINTVAVTGLSVFSVLCLLTIFTFAISFVLWIVLACLAITGGIQTLPLYKDLRSLGKISVGQQVAFSIMGGFFYTALIAAILAVFYVKSDREKTSVVQSPS